jgi:hypothetical protein
MGVGKGLIHQLFFSLLVIVVVVAIARRGAVVVMLIWLAREELIVSCGVRLGGVGLPIGGRLGIAVWLVGVMEDMLLIQRGGGGLAGVGVTAVLLVAVGGCDWLRWSVVLNEGVGTGALWGLRGRFASPLRLGLILLLGVLLVLLLVLLVLGLLLLIMVLLLMVLLTLLVLLCLLSGMGVVSWRLLSLQLGMLWRESVWSVLLIGTSGVARWMSGIGRAVQAFFIWVVIMTAIGTVFIPVGVG